MNFLDDIMRTVLGQNEDNYNQNQVESSRMQVESSRMQVDDSTIQGHDDKNLQCEKQIIQCQVTNGRLLGSTSTSLRKKYGDEVVNKAIQRLAKRRIRGKCSRTAEINKLSKTFEPLIDQFFKKKSEHEFGNSL